MAYPYNFIKVTFGGTVYSGADIWSNGINFGLQNADLEITKADLEGVAQRVSSDIAVWFRSVNAQISNRAQLEWVKVAVIGKDGKYELDADVFDLETPASGASTVVNYPQLTLALTMETMKRRSPGRFARIFPPLNAPVIGTNGRVAQSNAINQRDAFASLLKEMTDQLRVLLPGVVSPIVASEKTDQHYPILTVKVGDVVDTQRSRRNAIKETYTAPAEVKQETVLPPEEAE